MKNFKPVEVYPLVDSNDWIELTGDLPVKMTNDYLFRALLQSDNDTLKALLASVLKMEPGEIKSARVTNPILLGEAIDEKTFVMDVKVEMNDAALIDLEMQVVREPYWAERSVSYICRAFDNLNRGVPYNEVKPVRQIAFFDFTLFKEAPAFYSDYKLINTRQDKLVYTEKLIITNIDLTNIDLASEEDKKYKLDEWSSLFKAATWEDMKMLAEKNAAVGKAISAVWQLTEEERIREQCRAREDWIVNDIWKMNKIAQQEQELKKKDDAIKEKDDAIKKKDDAIKEKDDAIKEKDDVIKEKDDVIKEREDEIKMLKRKLAKFES